MQIGSSLPDPTSGISGHQTTTGQPAARTAGGVPFSQLMSEFLSDTDRQQHAVTHGIDALMSGENDHIHDLAIQVAQADVSFRLMMEVRDQLITAYQEVMRMQV